MKLPTNNDALQALLLQAAADGRGSLLFGESLDRARRFLPDFLPTDVFPDIYLEFPLSGVPFLDATVLYSSGETENFSAASPAAAGTQEMLSWFSGLPGKYKGRGICCGYELDTKAADLPAAGVHFQPRDYWELVEPFCRSLGEAWRAPLYLSLAERLKDSWPLSFFGLFRGRPDSPLRVCGYLPPQEQQACAKDAARIIKVFETVGFTAYNDVMAAQISALLAATPGQADFQFDIYPDGSAGSIFAVDARFDPKVSAAMTASFREGDNLRLMNLLESWGLCNDRWQRAVAMAFTRALPVEPEPGKTGAFALALLPQWIKIRWTAGRLQPAKLYVHAKAGLV